MRFLELCEEPVNDGTDEIVRDFVDFAGDRLGLERPPKIKLIRDPKQAAEHQAQQGKSSGPSSVLAGLGGGTGVQTQALQGAPVSGFWTAPLPYDGI